MWLIKSGSLIEVYGDKPEKLHDIPFLLPKWFVPLMPEGLSEVPREASIQLDPLGPLAAHVGRSMLESAVDSADTWCVPRWMLANLQSRRAPFRVRFVWSDEDVFTSF